MPVAGRASRADPAGWLEVDLLMRRSLEPSDKLFPWVPQLRVCTYLASLGSGSKARRRSIA